MSYVGVRNLYQAKTAQCYRQIELESMEYKRWEGALPAWSSGGNTMKEAVPAEEWAGPGLALPRNGERRRHGDRKMQDGRGKNYSLPGMTV